MRYKVKRNIEDDKGTSQSKKTRESGFIDTNAGQKLLCFIKHFKIFSFSYYTLK